MNVLHTQFVLDLQRYEIYLAGCKGVNGVHCSGCHNPQSWDFANGKPLTDKSTYSLYKKAKQSIVENIWILGGEPLDQNTDELLEFIQALQFTHKPIWLFTRYELYDVPAEILTSIDYLKTGAYRNDLLTDDNIHYGVKLASSNQRIFKFGE